MIERPIYFNQLLKWKGKQIIKVITGVRRSGKSTLLRMLQSYLCEEEPASHIIYINFEDMNFDELREYHKLHSYIKEQKKEGVMNYVLIDEVQEVPEFQRAINSLFLMEQIDIYVTGSNAHLLSSEFSTLLSGRYIEISMMPLSFLEYCDTSSAKESLEQLYRDYVTKSSFPYATQLSDQSMVNEYLNGIYSTIILKDVVERKKISDPQILDSIVKYLSDTVGNLISSKKISDTLTSMGRKVSYHTVEAYVSALCESYLFYKVDRYDIKRKQYLKSLSKYYICDLGLRTFLLGNKRGNRGFIIENIVFLELKRRYMKVAVGKIDQYEIDFVCIDGNGMRTYVQVSESIQDEEVYQQEIRSLNQIQDHFPKYLITFDQEPRSFEQGIQIINLLDFLTMKKESY